MSNSDDVFKDASPWELPQVDSNEDQSGRTNALNRPLYKWQFEPPESEQDELQPPTAEQIEEIQKAAHKDGYESGQEEGLEAGKKEGYENGFHEGLAAGTEQGKKEALEQSSEEIKQQITDLKTAIDALQTPVSLISNELKKELSLLAVTLAKHIVKKEVQHDESVLSDALTQALEKLPIAENKVEITVNPDQKAFVDKHIEVLFSTEEKPEIKLLVDETLELGGCIVSSKNNAVDMSIESRCEKVFSQVLNPLGIENDPRAAQ